MATYFNMCVCVCVYVFSCTCTLTLFQVQHGKLLCSFNSGHTELCVVQLLKAFIAGDEPMLNEQDCPLIQSTNIIMVINSKDIVAPVSLVHQCTSTCKFSLQTVTTTIERKSAEQNRLIFKHDFINDIYCINWGEPERAPLSQYNGRNVYIYICIYVCT